MNARATGQRPALLSTVIDALGVPIAVFEPGPSPLLALGNAAFNRIDHAARQAGLRLVEGIAERVAALAPGATLRYPLTIPTAHGSTELDCHVVEDSAGSAWVWWATDVTEERRAQATQAAAVADAGRRELELTRSNEDLERFASIASHDLSEPLRMVASFADLLARRYRGNLDEQADAYIGYILDGASRMRTLIDALLAFAELRASEHRREAVDLNALAAEVRDNLQVAIQETGAELHVGELPVITADREAMRQVLQNLIANAVKFHGAEAPRVTVSCTRDGDEWVISVTDNGIGIAAEHRDRVFDMFGRLHPRAAYAGSGLGLAMSRRAVELHGGRIWAENAPAGGTIFRFTLPNGMSTP